MAATASRARTLAKSNPEEDETTANAAAPWEQPAIDDQPVVSVEFTQTQTGRWTASRKIELRMNPMNDGELAESLDMVDRLDEAVRGHMKDLYERDQAEREEYFRQRDARNNGSYR